MSEPETCNYDNTYIIQNELSKSERVINEIKKQIEFYLSETNLCQDNFLLDKLEENNKGYIDIKIFLRFKKIRKIFLSNQMENKKYSEKFEMIKRAIEESNFLKLNICGNKIKRKNKFLISEDNIDELIKKKISNSIVIQNFKDNIVENDIFNFFKKFGKILSIKFRKYKMFKFNKSCIIEFYEKDIDKEISEKKKNQIINEKKVLEKIKKEKYNINIYTYKEWVSEQRRSQSEYDIKKSKKKTIIKKNYEFCDLKLNEKYLFLQKKKKLLKIFLQHNNIKPVFIDIDKKNLKRDKDKNKEIILKFETKKETDKLSQMIIDNKDGLEFIEEAYIWGDNLRNSRLIELAEIKKKFTKEVKLEYNINYCN